MLRADLHVHSHFSEDSLSTSKALLARCAERGINCLAITDHNTIRGGLEMREIAPFTIVVGAEMMSAEGEIIGLFLEGEVPRGLSAEETISRIKNQGGLVYLPHPFDRMWRGRLDSGLLNSILQDIDIVEVFNARTIFPADCAKALAFARQHGLLQGAGSDAHFPREIGKAYVEIPPFSTPQEFLASLAQGKVFGNSSHPAIHFPTTIVKALKRLGLGK